MKHSITEILGQAWFDHLSEYYDIGQFPPLHSLTFGEWCLIIDEKENFLSKERPLTTKTYSFNNDIWTIIEDDQRQRQQPLYSDIVRSIKPDSSSPSLLSFNHHQHYSQNKKMDNNNNNILRMMNDQIYWNTHDNDSDYDDIWLLSKSSCSHRRLKYIKKKCYQKNHILNQTSDLLIIDSSVNNNTVNHQYKRKKKEKRSRHKNHQTRFVRHQRKHNQL